MINNNKKKKSRKQQRRNKAARGGASLSVASEVRAIMRPPLAVIRGAVVEVKTFDTAFALANVGTAGSVTKISTITQGVGYNQRVGDELLIKGVELRFQAQGQAAAAAGQLLRLMVVQWVEDDATVAPTLAQVLVNTGVAADYPVSPYNVGELRQETFSVLVDELVPVVYTSTAPAGRLERPISARIRFNPAVTTGVGHIYVVAVADSTLSLHWVSRVIFTDS